jgi:uncharacterized membrane protein YbhN (UPF0104 family)
VFLAFIGGIGVLALSKVSRPSVKRFYELNKRGLLYVGLASCLQVSLLVGIFFVELHAVGSHANLGQVVTYTGAANLALFVSITPGAIGFRESFLILSERLHHINNATILAANVIDCSVGSVSGVYFWQPCTATSAG